MTATDPTTEIWMTCLQRRAQPQVRLICLPHAGGDLFTFLPWIEEPVALAPHIEAWALQLPRVPRFGHYAELVPALADAILAQFPTAEKQPPGVPLALFGHSLGALLAFGIARRLRALGAANPVCLVVVGAYAPQRLLPGISVLGWTDSDWEIYLRALGGTPDAVFADPTERDDLIAEVRDNFAVRTSFHYMEEPPFTFPIAVFAGRDDSECPEIADLAAWQDQTHGPFSLHLFPGGHFFLHNPDHRPRFLQQLSFAVAPWPATVPPNVSVRRESWAS